MPKYRVTYRCENEKCQYGETVDIEANSKAAAWKTAYTLCPAHEELGDRLPAKVEELG